MNDQPWYQRAALAFAERCLADHANRAKARGEG